MITYAQTRREVKKVGNRRIASNADQPKKKKLQTG